MTLARSALALAFALTLTLSAHAAPTAAAVLMVEDNEITEKIGVAAYRPFLDAGPYKKVAIVTGRERANERLALTIRRLAQSHDMIDVVLSVHTTDRDAAMMLKLIPPAARKLRLVYSTACYGATAEREAWEQLGARTVVTHVGLNNPLVALPYFLSKWIGGAQVGPAVTEAYREEAAVSRFAISLPGVGDLLNQLYGDSSGLPGFIAGSRPVISGSAGLRITSGLPHRARTPKHLVYARRTGSSPGLLLRAMADRYTLEGGDLASSLAALRLPQIPGIDPNLLRKVSVVGVYRDPSSGHGHSSRRDRELRAGKVVIKLARKQKIPLDQGFSLKVGKEITLKVGRVKPNEREMKLEVSGLWVSRGLLKYRITSMTVKPEGSGYKVKVGGGAWGVIPYWHSIPIGGSRPQPLPNDLTPLRASPGLSALLERGRGVPLGFTQ